MTFEWDEEKNVNNIEKHGFDFADAWQVFQTPMLIASDTREDYGEDRYVGIGLLQARIVVIVFTEPEPDTIRVISLRKAVKHERSKYEQILKDQLG
ncbi:MAG: BrnT family toxin [Trueperaceae bacterium]